MPSNPAAARRRRLRRAALLALVCVALIGGRGDAQSTDDPVPTSSDVPVQIPTTPGSTAPASTSTSTTTSNTTFFDQTLGPIGDVVTGSSTTSTTIFTFDPSSTVPLPDAATLELDGDASRDEEPPRIIPILPPLAINRPRNLNLEAELAKLTVEQRAAVAAAAAAADAAAARVTVAQIAVEEISARLVESRTRQARLQAKFDDTVSIMRRRAIEAYTGDQVDDLDLLLSADGAEAIARRVELLADAQREDKRNITQFRTQRAQVDRASDELEEIAAQRTSELVALQREQLALGQALENERRKLFFVNTGQAMSFNNFVFPVQLPANFVDTFGAPRMTGTKYEHAHEGVDIFAPSGAPLFAVVRGVVWRVGVATLGGNKLWLVGEDGTAYYYAHLSGFAQGLYEGKVLEAGEVVGFVGNTGNAISTPAHLHFEIHPVASGPVNPTSMLRAVYNADAKSLIEFAQNLTTTTVLGTDPSVTTTTGDTGAGGLIARAAIPRATSGQPTSGQPTSRTATTRFRSTSGVPVSTVLAPTRVVSKNSVDAR